MGIDLQRLKSTRGIDLTVWPSSYDAHYRPRSHEEHWLPEIECASENDRNEIIISKLTQQIRAIPPGGSSSAS